MLFVLPYGELTKKLYITDYIEFKILRGFATGIGAGRAEQIY